MLHADGVEVFVKCMAGGTGRYNEYHDPSHSPPPQNSQHHLESLIAVSPKERFAMQIVFKPSFNFKGATHVQIHIDIDDRAAEWEDVVSREQIVENAVIVVDRFSFIEGFVWRHATMSFEKLLGDKSSEDESIVLAQNVGMIKVRIRRGQGQKQAWSNCRPTRTITSECHPKLINSGVTLFARPSLKSMQQLVMPTKPTVLMQPIQDPGLQFIFKYRTQVTLSLLGVTCWSDEQPAHARPLSQLPLSRASQSRIPSITTPSLSMPTKPTKRVMVPSPEVSKTIKTLPIRHANINGAAATRLPSKASPLSKKQKRAGNDKDEEDTDYINTESCVIDTTMVKKEQAQNVATTKSKQTSASELLAKFQGVRRKLSTSIPVPPKEVNIIDLTNTEVSSPITAPTSSQSTLQRFFLSSTPVSATPVTPCEARDLQGMSEGELRIELQRLAILQELERRKDT